MVRFSDIYPVFLPILLVVRPVELLAVEGTVLNELFSDARCTHTRVYDVLVPHATLRFTISYICQCHFI